MNYTIATLEDVQNDLVIDFNRNGNKFTIGIKNNEIDEYTHKTYDNISSAVKVFQTLTEAILQGDYSYKQRKEML